MVKIGKSVVLQADSAFTIVAYPTRLMIVVHGQRRLARQGVQELIAELIEWLDETAPTDGRLQEKHDISP